MRVCHKIIMNIVLMYCCIIGMQFIDVCSRISQSAKYASVGVFLPATINLDNKIILLQHGEIHMRTTTEFHTMSIH